MQRTLTTNIDGEFEIMNFRSRPVRMKVSFPGEKCDETLPCTGGSFCITQGICMCTFGLVNLDGKCKHPSNPNNK